jgi:hypothetical protein
VSAEKDHLVAIKLCDVRDVFILRTAHDDRTLDVL